MGVGVVIIGIAALKLKFPRLLPMIHACALLVFFFFSYYYCFCFLIVIILLSILLVK